MPPVDSGKELSAGEVAILKRWIDEGAEWSPPWAYVSPIQHSLPKTQDDTWGLNWIDDFVLACLEQEGHTTAPDASKTTLIRRLSIDLTGLPPTSAEVNAFLNDDSPRAFERLVDRRLESPHFGERMAMNWLDLVRYADTVGYHGDQEHYISPYRDYVIGAFNANMPFDRFTREQLAGDLLPEPTIEQKIATGYNRLLQTSHEGGLQPNEYIAIYGADRVRNVSSVWMGATMGCAQCHDHKFDPYTMRDFYSMQAFFSDIDDTKHFQNGTNTTPTLREPELELLHDELQVELSALEGQLAKLKKQQALSRGSTAKTAIVDESKIENSDESDAERDEEIDADSDADSNSLSEEADNPKTVRNQSAMATADDLRTEIRGVERRIVAVHRRARRTMITVALSEPRVTQILPRGNWLDESGEIVVPAVPAFYGKLGSGDRRATRLDLANWLTDPVQGVGGLTARVMVNRFWYLMFGRGLSASLDDFGGQGEAPSHPELLDNLAIEFVVSGWDVKQLIKLIATSRAYRQSSRRTVEQQARDPMNVLVARQGRFRFPAEAVRDSTLMISGLLVNKVGGSSVKPYQPAGYYRHLNFPEREYEADLDQRQWRRGVYIHWQRQFLHPMLKAFDAPSREECTAQRSQSNTPLAALVLLNDPTFVEAARSFATRILTSAEESTDARLNFAFREATSRLPADQERQALVKLLVQSRREYSTNLRAVNQLLSIGLKQPPENVDRLELSSWTIVARTILSLNEALTRN